VRHTHFRIIWQLHWISQTNNRPSVEIKRFSTVAAPQSPWQRGSNENTNGLLRQYFWSGGSCYLHCGSIPMSVAQTEFEDGAQRENTARLAPASAPNKLRLSVVIPVYNERQFVGEILLRVQASGLADEIIVVDDASTDGTRQILDELLKRQTDGQLEVDVAEGRARLRLDTIRIFFQDYNQGKGAAVRRGFKEATGDLLLVQDADLEYDPKDYPKLLEPILDGRADVVYGSRFLGGPQRVHFFWHYVGNKFLTLLSDMVTNLNISDMESCYKVFRREVIEGIRLRSNRFGFEPEVTAKIAKMKWRVYEVPISYSGRSYEEGKKITWRDGFVALYSIVRYRLFD
jgi:glycosyltransferase involved in cell wall biosynthesis